MVSLGPIVLGAAQPHPDNKCAKTMLDGFVKRIAAKLPDPKRRMLRELKLFVRRWCRRRLVPLSPDTDLSFETWITSKKYPESRKEELRKIHQSMVQGKLTSDMRKVKCFMKDETYADYKHGRGIFSRVDMFKCLFGPLCSAIEEQVYQQPEFIKHVPVAERPKYIEEWLSSMSRFVCATDYTSFESSFSRELMDTIDKELFDYMTSKLDNAFLRQVYLSLMDDNDCKFKFFTGVIEARRMSGEMNTSLSNGFANLMVMSFLCDFYGLGDLRMVVEGDDGLAITSTGKFPTAEQFAELGFKIKIELHSMKDRASFCGIIYHPDDNATVTDPFKVMVKFGWASSAYVRCGPKVHKKLLRSKSMSTLHQYPRMPILQSLSLYGLRMTRSFDVYNFILNDRSLSQYEREEKLQACVDITTSQILNWKTNNPIGMATRTLVEEMYGIPVETQLRIEEYLDGLTELEPLDLTRFCDFPRPWTDYFMKYCQETKGEDIDLKPTPADPMFGWNNLEVGRRNNTVIFT